MMRSLFQPADAARAISAGDSRTTSSATRPSLALPLPLRRVWARLGRHFNSRPRRERLLIAAAAVVLLFWLLDLLLLQPRWLLYDAARRDAAVASQVRLSLETDLQRLQSATTQHLAQARGELQLLQTRLAAARSHLAAEAQAPTQTARPPANPAPSEAGDSLPGLVPPRQMLPLLQDLLARQHGLTLRSLQNLGRSPVSDAGLVAAARPGLAHPVPAQAAASGATATPDGALLYRHAVALSVEGSYADLLAYLQALEALPQHLLWGPMVLEVDRHPRVRLDLEIYTLSPQAAWVEL
ncbi:MAG: hypothetical protein RL722_2098 [Pseudomonadota bacterium]|jgi:MSHA biogenesis protein MshJ